MTEDEMVGWHHRLNGHEFEQTLGDSGGQGSLTCCSPWGSQRVRHDLATEQQQSEKTKVKTGWNNASQRFRLRNGDPVSPSSLSLTWISWPPERALPLSLLPSGFSSE